MVLEFEDTPNNFTHVSTTNPLPTTASVIADMGTMESYTSRLLTSATNIAPGAATATTSLVTGGRYNATQKTLTDGQEASWAMSARGSLMVSSGAETFNVTTASKAYSAAVDVTRPTNTNTYGANDVVGAAAAAMEFANVGAAGEYLVTGVSLRFDLAAVPATMTSFVLHLYNATPPSAPADEATFSLSASDAPKYLGAIPISAPVDYGDILYIEMSGLAKQVKLVSSSLWGVLVTVGTYAGASAGTHTVTVHTRAA
jgi:hypothetical protein